MKTNQTKGKHSCFSAVRLLRTMEGATIKALAEKIGFEYKALHRLEMGHNCQIERFQILAEYFGVTVDALVKNDFEAIARTRKKPVNQNLTLQNEMKKHNDECSRIGDKGQKLAFKWEIQRLRESGHTLAYLVNPNCADDRKLGFDMLSFTADNKPIFIEVKATKGSLDTPFHMSQAQISKAAECLEDGIEYQVHRIGFVDDIGKRILNIISARELLEDYCIKPSDYLISMIGA